MRLEFPFQALTTYLATVGSPLLSLLSDVFTVAREAVACGGESVKVLPTVELHSFHFP